uniref:Protein lin-52 homolog n=1 Tax=Heterorhabditis bacteriophora TaxID=37862 RepID=A0A1I7XK94_HETBA
MQFSENSSNYYTVTMEPKHVAPGQISLTCPESLRRAPSPELFPENVPGAWQMNRENEVLLPGSKQRTFRTDLEPDDVKLVNELGRLTPDQLAEYIKTLQSSAFSLGVEEARQFSKGKVLQIFKRRSDIML